MSLIIDLAVYSIAGGMIWSFLNWLDYREYFQIRDKVGEDQLYYSMIIRDILYGLTAGAVIGFAKHAILFLRRRQHPRGK